MLLVLVFMSIHLELLRSGLSGLANDMLAGVPDSLTLIRLGRTETANYRGDLPYRLFVDPLASTIDNWLEIKLIGALGWPDEEALERLRERAIEV